MDLYRERGFDQTTVAEIAARAGLTERTFFRHFADKREVLFAGAGELADVVVAAVVGAPAGASPIEAAAAGLTAAAEVIRDREFSRLRQNVIQASGELRERELIKLASLAAAIAAALRERGVGEPAASLTGEVAMAVFRIAFERWVEDGSAGELAEEMASALEEVRAVTAG
jgi:AcrR family transcriptional regulator